VHSAALDLSTRIMHRKFFCFVLKLLMSCSKMRSTCMRVEMSWGMPPNMRVSDMEPRLERKNVARARSSRGYDGVLQGGVAHMYIYAALHVMRM
jgi:hypothetical protein